MDKIEAKKTLLTWPYARWTTVTGYVDCSYDTTTSSLTVSGSGTYWSASGSTISISSSNGSANPYYHILNLNLPSGYSWGSPSDRPPKIEFNRGGACGIYTDFGRIPVYNTLSGTNGVSYQTACELYTKGSAVSGSLTISFLPPA